MRGQPDGQFLALKRIWTRLPNTPMSGDACRDAIIAGGNLYEFDWAGGDARRTMLVQLAALTTRMEDEKVVYVRSEAFPEWVDRGPGSPAHNEWLARQSAAEREMLEGHERASLQAQRDLDRPIREREQAEFNRRVDARLEVKLRELGLLPDTESALAGAAL